jgi:hypothetical protein
MSVWKTALIMPGVVPIHKDAGSGAPTADGTFLDLYNDAAVVYQPLIPPDTGDEQGTPFRFQTNSFGTIHERAWRTVGWGSCDISFGFRYPTNTILRASNASSPLTGWYDVGPFTINASVIDQYMSKATAFNGDGSPVPRAGSGSTFGELSPNVVTDLQGIIGPWALSGITSVYSEVHSTVIASIAGWDSDGTTPLGIFDLTAHVRAQAYGNSSLLRYRAGVAHDGEWIYCNLFTLNLEIRVGADSAPSGVIWQGADGSHDSDEPPGSPEMNAKIITTIADPPYSVDDAPVGAVNFLSNYIPSGGVNIYEDKINTLNYDVPWSFDNSLGPVASVPSRSEFRNVSVTFRDPVYSIPPAAL